MKVKMLLYCTKGKPYLRDYRGMAVFNKFVVSPTERPFTSDDMQPILNGKIVAECEVETEEISFQVPSSYGCYEWGDEEKCYEGSKTENYDLLKKSCLTEEEIDNYLNGKGYALHISNLKIFETPLKIPSNELLSYSYKNDMYLYLKKAPMNMYRVFHNREWKVLISIQPQWVCKILNGEKTIEVRKKVLKGMCD